MERGRVAASRAFDEENWAVNPNVHYNEWANFGVEDFRAVLDAYKRLFGVFVCSTCGGGIAITEEGETPTGVRCPCGAVSLNLRRKPGVTR
jgi:DNA-directed RNA polymerase subunit RPC12/RpoP